MFHLKSNKNIFSTENTFVQVLRPSIKVLTQFKSHGNVIFVSRFPKMHLIV